MTSTSSAVAPAAASFSPDDIRRILLEHRYLLKADELCAKWQITRATLRAWKKAARFEYLSGDLRELVIAALASGGNASLAELTGWVDYQDHSACSESELRAVIDGLVRDGIAAWVDATHVRYAPTPARQAARFVF